MRNGGGGGGGGTNHNNDKSNNRITSACLRATMIAGPSTAGGGADVATNAISTMM